VSKISDFNSNLAAKITKAVGTMWCAYVFAGITFLSLPAAISSHSLIVIVSWIAQTFLQLVLLSIIMVGQSVQSASVEQKITETHTASLAEFELAKEARAIAAEEISDLKEIMAALHTKVVAAVSEK
jgi:hypothetical protein